MKVWVCIANTPSVWTTERRAKIAAEWFKRHGEWADVHELEVNPDDFLYTEDEDEEDGSQDEG